MDCDQKHYTHMHMLQSLSTVFLVSVVAGNLTGVKKCEISGAFEGREIGRASCRERV